MPSADINGISLSYEVAGEGEPMLFFPGLGTGKRYYRLGEPLLRERFQTILIDPRGIGDSHSDQTEFVTEDWADDGAALLDHLGIEKAHLVGSSHGGCMAMSMTDRHPDRVASLSLVGAFSELDRLMEINFRFRIKLVGKLGMGEEIADHISMWTMSHQFLETDAGKKIAEGNFEMVGKNDPDRYLALNRSILHWGRCLEEQAGEPKFTERLPSFSVPTLALTGDSDQFIPASFSRLIADRVPGCAYEEIADCGHIPMLEKPEEAARIISDFAAAHPLA